MDYQPHRNQCRLSHVANPRGYDPLILPAVLLAWDLGPDIHPVEACQGHPPGESSHKVVGANKSLEAYLQRMGKLVLALRYPDLRDQLLVGVGATVEIRVAAIRKNKIPADTFVTVMYEWHFSDREEAIQSVVDVLQRVREQNKLCTVSSSGS